MLLHSLLVGSDKTSINIQMTRTSSNAQGLNWCKHVAPYIYAGKKRLLDGYMVRPGMERMICELCFGFTCYLKTNKISKITKII